MVGGIRQEYSTKVEVSSCIFVIILIILIISLAAQVYSKKSREQTVQRQSFDTKRHLAILASQTGTEPHQQQNLHGTVFFSFIPAWSTVSIYLTISSHCRYPEGKFLAFNGTSDDGKDEAQKKDKRARPQAYNVYETMYDDNLHDVTSHMRMLHGDVISQTHGPGVNLFKPAVNGRRFWVLAKSPVFG